MRRLYVLSAPFVSRLGASEKYIAREELQPEETEAIVPPWISPASRDRISGSTAWGRLETEVAALEHREARHGAVVRFVHGPGIVGPDGYVTKRARLRFSDRFTRNILTAPLTQAARVSYINNLADVTYFGHWLTDAIPQTELVADGSYYLTNPSAWTHCADYRQALGLRVRDDRYISADEIITYSDYAQGSLKRQRYATLKARLADAFAPEPAKSSQDKVFLWRGATGAARRFQEEDRLRHWLQSDGWRVIDMNMSLAQMFPIMANAEVVAGMEGSHLNHAHFCTRPGTALVILVPHDQFTAQHLGIARAVGNVCGFHVMPGSVTAGYALETDALTETVEQTCALVGKTA